MELKDRIAAARNHAELTQEQLAKAVKLTQQAIARLESGLSKESKRITQIAAACGVNARWLAEGVGDMIERPAAANDDDWSNIRFYTQSVGLGNGREAVDYAEAHKLKFRTSSLRRKGLNPGALCVVYGTGDSMLPRIHSGDAILYDESDTKPRHKTIFVIRRGKEYSAKVCRILDDRVYFEALNPDGDHVWKEMQRMDSKRDPIEILGRVRWIGSWED